MKHPLNEWLEQTAEMKENSNTIVFIFSGLMLALA